MVFTDVQCAIGSIECAIYVIYSLCNESGMNVQRYIRII